VGRLYVVATPIGNLEDITLRALRLLQEVRLIAAEDTRHTRTLLDRYGIETPVVRYDEHSHARQLPVILRALEQGEVALVSDAGTPGISDPGAELVRAAVRAGHTVSPIPGPSAAVAAIAAAGMPAETFVFLGYLPRRASDRVKLLAKVADETRTMVAFEVPHRLRASLSDLEKAFGAERVVALAREVSKVHEEFIHGTLGEVRRGFEKAAPRGEFTLVIAGQRAGPWPEDEVRAEVARRMRLGQAPAEAAREVARASGWPRQKVYRMALRSP
jgi:16S rRNA (cytidine1402-2'-O)-methyltransferase